MAFPNKRLRLYNSNPCITCIMCIYHGNDQTFTEAIDIYENHHIASACIFILLHLYAKFKNIYLSRRIDNDKNGYEVAIRYITTNQIHKLLYGLKKLYVSPTLVKIRYLKNGFRFVMRH